MKLDGALVVVTGASSGIGAAVARQMGRLGARVVLVARRAEKLEEVAADIEAAGGQAHVVPADLSVMDSATGAGEAILALGVPDVLINNAGTGAWKYIDETPPEEAVQMMALPYFASFWLTRSVIEPMMARGSGLVLMVNSPAWMMGWSGATGYACSRAAQHQFAESLREDVRSKGIVVSEVTLGEVSSAYFEANADSHDRLPTIGRRLFGVLTPEQAAQSIVSAVQGERERVHAPFMLSLVHALNSVLPWTVRPLVRATQHRR